MCRFVCYKGSEIPLAELLYRPRNSLISQSYHALERSEPLNGDGFGIGWYGAGDPSPCVFTSVTPAWSNRNLQHLAEHIRSGCFFAHVRAATPGMRVSEANCHPFRYGPFLWMHNGAVAGFRLIRRKLCEQLPDPLYLSLEGTTDSEHVFALFLSLLGNTAGRCPAGRLAEVLVQTISTLEKWKKEAGVRDASHCNFAVTDGLCIAACRYVSDPLLEPISLYFSSGKRFVCSQGCARLVEGEPRHHAVIVSSERLTERKEDWKRVAPNHVLTVDDSGRVSVQLMDFSAA